MTGPLTIRSGMSRRPPPWLGQDCHPCVREIPSPVCLKHTSASSVPRGEMELPRASPWVLTSRGQGPLKGGDESGLIPDVPLVPFHAVFFEHPPVFVLEGDLAMMLRLSVDVVLQCETMRWAEGEYPVSRLPMESC
jgi:hypothetical protein